MAKKVTAQGKPHGFGCCLDCKHSELMQWGEDPVIAQCSVLKTREVAAIKRCARHERTLSPKSITHYKKRYGICLDTD